MQSINRNLEEAAIKTITAVLCAAMVLLLVGCGKGNTSNAQIDFMGLLPVVCQKGLLQFFAAAPSALFKLRRSSGGIF